jgi:hypothetical protein
MPVPMYPSVLPCFNANPYSIAPKSGTLQSEMESGQTRARRVRRDYATTISAEATMTRTEAALFWGFWDYEANLGDTAVYIPLLAEDGVIDQRLVRIVPDPKEEVIGGDLVKITLSLLLIQSGRLTADLYEYYLTGGSVELIESQAALFYNPLATVTNITIPGEI